MNILILGSSGQIGTALKHEFAEHTIHKRDRDVGEIQLLIYGNFILNSKNSRYDLIINCIGKSDPNYIDKISEKDIDDYIMIDKCIIDHIRYYPNCAYVYLSSWICEEHIEEHDRQYKYWLYKKFIEMRHRLYPELKIIDLRIPAFFSRWIDINAGFYISALLKAKKENKEPVLFDTKDSSMSIVTPSMLRNFIMDYKDSGNKAIDLRQEFKFVTKNQLLKYILPESKITLNNLYPFKDENLNEFIKEYKELGKLNVK